MGNYLLKKGQTLFKEGSFSESAFIIESGEIEISKTDEKGEKVVIDVLESTEIIGEMGLIDGQPRSVTATAKTEATIKEITQAQFKNIAKKYPQDMMPILKFNQAIAQKFENGCRKVTPKIDIHLGWFMSPFYPAGPL